MSTHSRAVLLGAVVFALAMGALEHGGWWWAWFTAAAVILLRKSVHLRPIGVKLHRARRYIIRENHRVHRHHRELARRQRHRRRQQRRAQRVRRRQAQ